MSDAATNLASRQKAKPPKWHTNEEPKDYAVACFEKLKSSLPAWARDNYASGMLVCVEIGDYAPDVHTVPFTDGSFGITMSSAYVRLIRALANNVAATVPILPDGSSNTPILSELDFATQTASLIEQYNRIQLGYVLDIPPLELPPRIKTLGTGLFESACVFSIAHELGHVSIGVNKLQITDEFEEREADTFATLMLFASAERLPLGQNYAGAYVAMRAHVLFERACLMSTHKLESFDNRIQRLQASIRTDIASNWITKEQIAWAESTIDRLFQVAENMIRFLHLSSQKTTGQQATSNKGIMKASQEIQKLKATQPPYELNKDGDPHDRTVALLGVLSPHLPDEVNTALRSGRLVIAELGRGDVSAPIETFDDGSAAIVLDSGLLSLFEAVSRFLHMRFGVLENGASTGSIASSEVIVATIAILFQDLATTGITAQTTASALPGFWFPIASPGGLPDFAPLSDKQIALAYELAEGAAVFMLQWRINQWLMTQQGKADADLEAEALSTFLVSQSVAYLGFRRALPAALFTLRVLSCWSRAKGGGPRDGRYFEPIRNAPWQTCGSPKAYQHMAGIARVCEEVMQAVERALGGELIAANTDVQPGIVIDIQAETQLWVTECIAWNLAGGIYVYATETEEMETLVQQAKQLINQIPADLIETFARALKDRVNLKATSSSEADREEARQQNDILLSLVEQLPAEIAKRFRNVIGGSKPKAPSKKRKSVGSKPKKRKRKK